MLRYCPNCKNEYEFAPTAVSGKDDLICPECRLVIPKNSRRPASEDADVIEEGIGRAFSGIFRFAYIFYMVVAVIGILGYIFKADSVLYGAAAVAIAVFLIQFVTGTLIFTLGFVFLPIGAVIGYLVFGNIQGICIGVLAVFLIRHLIRDILWELMFKLIGWGN